MCRQDIHYMSHSPACSLADRPGTYELLVHVLQLRGQTIIDVR